MTRHGLFSVAQLRMLTAQSRGRMHLPGTVALFLHFWDSRGLPVSAQDVKAIYVGGSHNKAIETVRGLIRRMGWPVTLGWVEEAGWRLDVADPSWSWENDPRLEDADFCAAARFLTAMPDLQCGVALHFQILLRRSGRVVTNPEVAAICKRLIGIGTRNGLLVYWAQVIREMISQRGWPLQLETLQGYGYRLTSHARIQPSVEGRPEVSSFGSDLDDAAVAAACDLLGDSSPRAALAFLALQRNLGKIVTAREIASVFKTATGERVSIGCVRYAIRRLQAAVERRELAFRLSSGNGVAGWRLDLIEPVPASVRRPDPDHLLFLNPVSRHVFSILWKHRGHTVPHDLIADHVSEQVDVQLTKLQITRRVVRMRGQLARAFPGSDIQPRYEVGYRLIWPTSDPDDLADSPGGVGQLADALPGATHRSLHMLQHIRESHPAAVSLQSILARHYDTYGSHLSASMVGQHIRRLRRAFQREGAPIRIDYDRWAEGWALIGDLEGWLSGNVRTPDAAKPAKVAAMVKPRAIASVPIYRNHFERSLGGYGRR